MNAEGLINVFQAVKHGSLRQIKNLKTGAQGIAVDVKGDRLIVQVEKVAESWAYEDCE